jgi:hypothetical protein
VLLYTVGRLLPLICTTEFVFVKPLPVTVNVKVGFPAATEAGLIVVITGCLRTPDLAYPHQSNEQKKSRAPWCGTRLTIHGATCCHEHGRPITRGIGHCNLQMKSQLVGQRKHKRRARTLTVNWRARHRLLR